MSLLKTNNLEKFCPNRIKGLFHDPLKCVPTTTIFRTYFPKYGNKHIGHYEEFRIDGLYFEHIFDGGRLLWAIIILTSTFVVVALGVGAYWWLDRKDLPGSSNIGAFIIAIGTFVVAVLIGIPVLER